MKILLLHPEDRFPLTGGGGWDLVIDFARAPLSTYEQWAREANCPVIGLYDFAEEIEDLHRTRELLQFGMGQIVDSEGIDWWDVMSLMIVPELQQLMLLSRLAKKLPPSCELHTRRPALPHPPRGHPGHSVQHGRDRAPGERGHALVGRRPGIPPAGFAQYYCY